jgi:hypothetical protein
LLELPEELNGYGNGYYFPVREDPRHEYFYDIWSNIHYGYVGIAAGFDADTLQWAHASRLPFTGGHDPADTVSVQAGIDLWKTRGIALTKNQLHEEILSRTNEWKSVQEGDPGTIIQWTNGK